MDSRLVLYALMSWVIPSLPSASQVDEITAVVNGTALWTISPYLSTMSFVYTWAPDVVYKNGSMAQYAQRIGINTARYPAGEASLFNWENPTGIMGQSSLDPSWDGKKAPEEDWMSLEEYLDFCHAAGITKPLIGVNYNCHRSYFVPQNDSIQRAVRQVKFVVSRGFPGAFYYIGNEDEAEQHAEQIKAHALAMKEVDPTMKVFFNNNDLNPSLLRKFMAQVGTVIDGAEFHDKWPFGGQPHLPSFDYTQWLEEVPLVAHRNKATWRERIEQLRETAREIGRPDLLLANNEYGLGKPRYLTGFNKYTKSLVSVEFALEMYVGGYDMAVFWDNGDGGHKDHADAMLMDTQSDYRMNPVHLGLAMLGRCVNDTMLRVTTSQKQVHGFAAHSPNNDDLRIFLINKFESDQTVSIATPFDLEENPAAEAMVDSADHWGMMESIKVDCSSPLCKLKLPRLSFTLITARRRASPVQDTYVV